MRINESNLRRVSQPTLFLWGKDDPFGPLEARSACVREINRFLYQGQTDESTDSVQKR